MLSRIRNKILSNKFNYLVAPIIVGIASSGLIFENIVTIYCYYQFLVLFHIIILIPITFKILPNSQLYSLHNVLYIFLLCHKHKKQSSKQSPQTSNKKTFTQQPLILHSNKLMSKIKQQIQTFKNQSLQWMQTMYSKNGSSLPIYQQLCGVEKFKSFHFVYRLWWGNYLQSYRCLPNIGISLQLFAVQFLLFSIKHFFDLKNQVIQPMSEGIVTIWLILSFISFFLSLSMCSLSISNIVLAGKNITQLQMLKGHFKFIDKHGLNPNPYDLGFFTNLNNIFQGDKWLFWWPTQIISQNDGTQWPMIPQVLSTQIQNMSQNIKQDIKSINEKLIPSTIQQLIKKQQDNYKSTIFFFLGQQYRIGDDDQYIPMNTKPTIIGQGDYRIQMTQNLLQSSIINQRQKQQQKYQQQLQKQALNNLKQIQVSQQQQDDKKLIKTIQKQQQQTNDNKKILQDIYDQIVNQNQEEEQQQKYKQLSDQNDQQQNQDQNQSGYIDDQQNKQ